MFSQERMSRQKFALVAGMMPIMEYEKGGGGGGYVSPPPPDFTPQWNQVISKSHEAIRILDEEVGPTASAITSAADWQGKQAATNAKIDNAVALIDEALAINSNIPADWFGRSGTDRNDGINNLQKCRENLLAYRDLRKPTLYERLSSDINTLTLKMYAQGRYLSAPTQPLPADVIWFPGTWNYDLYNKGYSVQEIQWAVDYNQRVNLTNQFGSDAMQFRLEIEKALDQAILNGEVAAKKEQENIHPPGWNGTGIEPSLISQYIPPFPEPPAPAGYYPTGDVIGTGTYTGGVYPSYVDTVYAEDGSEYPNSTAVPKDLRYSRKPWEYRNTGNIKPSVEPWSCTFPTPGELPPGLRRNTPEYALWLRRKGRNSGFSSIGNFIPPQLGIVNPNIPSMGLSYDSWLRQQNRNRDCQLYTGPITDFDHQIMGCGFDMPTIHATRAEMRRSKLKPRAARGTVAIGIGSALAQLGRIPFGNRMSANMEIDAAVGNENVSNSLGQRLAVIPGISPINRTSVGIRQKVLARRACNLPRRGLVPSANMETLGNDSSGGSNQ